MLRNNRVPISNVNMWCFIGGVRKNNESFEKTILREIAKETSLNLNSIKLLVTFFYKGGEKNIYHAILTADDLNNIKRGEGKNLDFFSLQELEKLSLETPFKMFFSKNKGTVAKILHI